MNELVFRYGVPGTKFHTWHEWRDPSPHTHIPENDPMKRSLLCTGYSIGETCSTYCVTLLSSK